MTNIDKDIDFILYARKSSESGQRQLQSIEDQIERMRDKAEHEGLNVVEVIDEAKSAKEPGKRPGFQRMIDMIQNDEAQGILTWKIDRISRNPIDSGNVQWMLQKGNLEEIRTYQQNFQPEDNAVLFSVESGTANQYIKELRTNSIRGMKKRAREGHKPTHVPLGYKHKKGESGTINVPNDDMFDWVRRMWDLLLEKRLSPEKITKIANEEWGIEEIRGSKLGSSTIYDMFRKPFYYGEFEFMDEMYEGRYEPMITKEEFEEAQRILDDNSKPRAKKHDAVYRGMMECGHCGASITSEHRMQVRCTHCGNKFSCKNRNDCPDCDTEIDEMENPTIREYFYYRCTGQKKDVDCPHSGTSIRRVELEDKIKTTIEDYTISKQFFNWALETLNENDELRSKKIKREHETKTSNLSKLEDNLDELQRKYYKGEIDKGFFEREKKELKSKINRLKTSIEETEKELKERTELTRDVFSFAAHAREKMENGTNKEKKRVFEGLCSNCKLKGKKLLIEAHEWLKPLKKHGDDTRGEDGMFELEKEPENKGSKKENDTTNTSVGACPDLNRSRGLHKAVC